MDNVYSRLEDALDALCNDKQSPPQVSVTKEVYDLFDPLEHLDLARVKEHKGESGPGSGDGSVYLQTVGRWCDHVLDASTGRWVADSWYLGWCRADAAALHAVCGTMRAVYRNKPSRRSESTTGNQESSLTSGKQPDVWEECLKDWSKHLKDSFAYFSFIAKHGT